MEFEKCIPLRDKIKVIYYFIYLFLITLFLKTIEALKLEFSNATNNNVKDELLSTLNRKLKEFNS